MVRPGSSAAGAPIPTVGAVLSASDSAQHGPPGAASRFSGPPRLAPQVSLSRQQPQPSPRGTDSNATPPSRQTISFRGPLASPGSVQRMGHPPPNPGYSLATTPGAGAAVEAVDDEFDDAPEVNRAHGSGLSGQHQVQAAPQPSGGARGGIVTGSHRQQQQQQPPLSSLATASSFSGLPPASPPSERFSSVGATAAASASLSAHRPSPVSRLRFGLGSLAEAGAGEVDGTTSPGGDVDAPVHIRSDDDPPVPPHQQQQPQQRAGPRLPGPQSAGGSSGGGGSPATAGGGVTIARGSRGIVMQPVLPPPGAPPSAGPGAAGSLPLTTSASLGEDDLRPWARGGAAGAQLQQLPQRTPQASAAGGQTLRRPPSFAPTAAAHAAVFGSDADEIAEF